MANSVMTDSEKPSSEESFEEIRARAEAGDANAQSAVNDVHLIVHCTDSEKACRLAGGRVRARRLT